MNKNEPNDLSERASKYAVVLITQRSVVHLLPPQLRAANKPPSYKPSSSSLVQSGAKLVPNAFSITPLSPSSNHPCHVRRNARRSSSFTYVRVELSPTRDRRPCVGSFPPRMPTHPAGIH